MLDTTLLVPAEQDAPVPAEDRRDPDPGLGSQRSPDEPKPPSPRVRLRQLARLDDLDRDRRNDEQLGDAHPRLDREGLLAVGVEQDHANLAAIAGVDHPRRVDDREPVAQRQARARHDETCVAVRDLDRDACSDSRPLAGPDRERLAGAEIEAGVAAARPRRQHRVVAESRDA